MKCKKFKRGDLLLYYYGELNGVRRLRVEEHVKECAYCREFLKQQNAFGKLLDKDEVPQVSPLILERLNEQVIDRLTEEERDVPELKKGFLTKVIGILYYPMSKPVYAFSSLLVMFVVGLIIGKIWMGSAILNDPGLLASLIESRSEMSREERDYLKKLVAGYFLGSKELEVKGVKEVKAGDSGNGWIQVDFKINKEMNLTGGLDDPVILNVLRYSALYDRDPEKRVRAVRMLYLSKRFAENKEVFLAVLLNDKDPGPRVQALEAVTEFVGDEEVKEALKKVLLNDPDEKIRMQALDVLGKTGDRSLIPIFALVAYRDSSETLQMRAKEILAKLYDREKEKS